MESTSQPQPFPSWIINEENGDWESPIGPAPQDGEPRSFYHWDEEAHQADNSTGWVLKRPPSE